MIADQRRDYRTTHHGTPRADFLFFVLVVDFVFVKSITFSDDVDERLIHSFVLLFDDVESTIED